MYYFQEELLRKILFSFEKLLRNDNFLKIPFASCTEIDIWILGFANKNKIDLWCVAGEA